MDSEGGDHGPGRYDVSEDRRSVRTLTMFGRSPSKAIKVEVFAKTDLGRTRDHDHDRRGGAGRPLLPVAGGRQPRLLDSPGPGRPAHQGPVPDAAPGRGG